MYPQLPEHSVHSEIFRKFPRKLLNMRRIRPSSLLRSKLLRVCFVTLSLLGIYFVGFSTQPYEFHEIQQPIATGYDFVEYKALLEDKERTARRNLIIVSHGRSGSTLTGDIFNHHPSVFYMYEPLQTAKRVQNKLKINDTGYSSLVEELLTGVFHCKFDNPDILDDIEGYYRKPDHPRVSHAIGSPPLCPYQMSDPRWSPTLCKPMTSDTLGSACMDTYDLTVVKILMSRIPEYSIKKILTACGPPDIDCKVIFLVRDPRAVIPSSLNMGFFKEKGHPNAHWGTRLYSYKQCKDTEDNLELIRKLPDSLRHRIKLLRYEDLAIEPLKVLEDIYEFAGLPVLESVRIWLNETTQQSRKACDSALDGPLVTCTKDDAWAAANRWRWKVHPHEIDIIERYCRRAMDLMGYRLVDRSYDLLANADIPLFSSNYEAKHWFH